MRMYIKLDAMNVQTPHIVLERLKKLAVITKFGQYVNIV